MSVAWYDMHLKTRTPDLLGMSYACANMVHSPGYADDLRQYTSLNRTWSEKYFLEFSLFRSIWLERPEKLIRRLSSPWVITSHLQQWLLLLQNQTWQWGTLSCANLLVVSCLKLKELGCVVDEGEENHTYYVSTSLAHVSLGIVFFCFSENIILF